jgi:hypothetical protein
MILDNETQRQILLQMFDNFNFQGSILEQALALKIAIKAAEITKPEQEIPANQ